MRIGFNQLHWKNAEAQHNSGPEIMQQMPWSPAASVRSEDFIRFPSGTTNYFSEQFTFDDFNKLNIPVTPEMQKRIASFETLAQLAIQYIFSCSSPISRFPLRFQSLTNNSVLKLVAINFFRQHLHWTIFGTPNITLYYFWNGTWFVTHFQWQKWRSWCIESLDFSFRSTFWPWTAQSFCTLFRSAVASEASISLHPPETYLAWQIP